MLSDNEPLLYRLLKKGKFMRKTQNNESDHSAYLLIGFTFTILGFSQNIAFLLIGVFFFSIGLFSFRKR